MRCTELCTCKKCSIEEEIEGNNLDLDENLPNASLQDDSAGDGDDDAADDDDDDADDNDDDYDDDDILRKTHKKGKKTKKTPQKTTTKNQNKTLEEKAHLDHVKDERSPGLRRA